jgi:hypothetical protein
MKTILFLTFLFCSFVSWTQFNEGFFEILEPENSKKQHFGGCHLANNGMLGVRFAIDGTKEVQWVKMNELGEYEFFSADLPQNLIPDNEYILEVFEESNFQYIITQDANADINLRGFHFYKYENYTTLISSNFISRPVRNTKTSVYMKYDIFYLLCNELGDSLMLHTITPQDLSLIQTQLIASSIKANTMQFFRVGENFIQFFDENNQDFFTRSDSNIVRVKLLNNQLQNPEYFDLDAWRLLGLNNEETKLLIYKNDSGSKKINKHFLDSALTFESSISLPNMSVSSDYSNYLQICSYGSHDFIFNQENEAYLFENNIKIDSFLINSSSMVLRINKIDVSQNKITLIGSKNVTFSPKFMLVLVKNDFERLTDFKEYGGVYNFDNYSTHIGIGTSIFNDLGFLRDDNFIFYSKIYFSGQCLSGKSGSNYYGTNGLYGISVFKPGPYTNSTSYHVSVVDKYNENFYVTQQMLNEHVNAINNADPSYRMPKGIKNWPAHGDVSKGQAPNLAPFVDVNNNGIYEPLLGDFPSFPGTNCLLNITHQLESDFSNTGSGLEMHTYMYNFDCMDSIKDAIFLKTHVFNRGTIDYDSLAYGIYNDFDLGYYGDDYIGTNVENGLIYAYNGDLIDEQGPNSGGFGDSLPTMANMFLKGVPFSQNGQDDIEGVSEFQTINGFGFDDGILDNEFKSLEYSICFQANGLIGTGEPTSSQDYFFYLNGRWLDGSPQLYGGTGTPFSSGATQNTAKYVYPSDSDPYWYGTTGIDLGFIWDEITNNNPKGDRRIMGSFGSTPLAPGESITYHSAYLAGKRVPGMGQSEIDLFAKAAHVKKAFNANITSCGQTFDNLTEDQITSVPKKQKEIDFKIYPNPMEELVNIELSDEYATGNITFADINGKICLQTALKGMVNSISVKDLPNGFYVVKIQSKQGTKQYKLIKK